MTLKIMNKVFLQLGSNLGEREILISSALTNISTQIGTIISQSKEDLPPELGLRGEALPARGTRQPAEPTAQERSIHELTHLPYRSWCQFCVLGRGEADHAKRRNKTRPITQIGYCLAPIDGAMAKLTMLTAVDVETLFGNVSVCKIKGIDRLALFAIEQLLSI